ncbi:unnamed protein product [Caenorhabditis auriculariae]|uniref:Uncharacterized protein n=1 Tax=Caenorhabditis auriculariae TaxID=2777116 RepID=A0A8S1HZ27_9PELO|nr:unnamed protein product [Caenorhabditis auriculariae]
MNMDAAEEIKFVVQPEYTKTQVMGYIAAGNFQSKQSESNDLMHVQCCRCNKLLSTKTRGGQLKRHVMITCPSRKIRPYPRPGSSTPPTFVSVQSVTPPQRIDYSMMRQAIFQYIIVSGTPFEHANSDVFRKLILNTGRACGVALDERDLPTAESMAQDIRKTIAAMSISDSP